MTGGGKTGKALRGLFFLPIPVHPGGQKSENKRVYGLARQVISCYNTKRKVAEYGVIFRKSPDLRSFQKSVTEAEIWSPVSIRDAMFIG